MWEVERALTESLHFTQIAKNRWKAEYKGFVTMAAEGNTPTESERQLSRAMDVLLASLIRGPKDGETTDTIFAMSSLMLSDAITVVQNTAKQPRRIPRVRYPASSSTPEDGSEGKTPPNVKTFRKRR
jgi:hypothetical protein